MSPRRYSKLTAIDWAEPIDMLGGTLHILMSRTSIILSTFVTVLFQIIAPAQPQQRPVRFTPHNVATGEQGVELVFPSFQEPVIGLVDGKPRATRPDPTGTRLVLKPEDTTQPGLHEILIQQTLNGVVQATEPRLAVSIPVNAARIFYSTQRDRLYVVTSTTGTATFPAHSVAELDPATGDRKSLIVLPSAPNAAALAADGSTLYVAPAGGSSSIQTVDLRNAKLGTSFPTGMTSAVAALATNPTDPDLLAASFFSGEVAILRDHVRLTQTVQTTPVSVSEPPSIAFSSSGVVLVTGLGFARLQYGDRGFAQTAVPLAAGGYGRFVAEAGSELFTTYGVFDSLTGSMLRRYPAVGTPAIDVANQRLFIAASNGIYTFELKSQRMMWFVPFEPAYPPSEMLVYSPGRIAISHSLGLLITETPQATAAPSIAATGVRDAASLTSGAIAPGEILSIFGERIGPLASRAAVLESPRVISRMLGDVQVLFGSTRAPLLYAGPSQLNVVAPYDLDGKPTVTLEVFNSGVPSNTVELKVVGSAPSLFTADGTGLRNVAAVNQDGTANGSASAAPAGSVLSLYATGGGQTAPYGEDGSIADTPLPVVAAGVDVTIDGIAAEVLYAGAAPGLVSGVMQLNVRVPQTVHHGTVPILLKMGSQRSQEGVTVNIR